MSTFYRMEKRLHGVRARCYSEGWLGSEARAHGLVLVQVSRPLAHNLVALLQRPLCLGAVARGPK